MKEVGKRLLKTLATEYRRTFVGNGEFVQGVEYVLRHVESLSIDLSFEDFIRSLEILMDRTHYENNMRGDGANAAVYFIFDKIGHRPDLE